MIDRCFNPACNRKLHYLREGRVIRIIHGKDENVTVKHYWLCGACFNTYEFLFPPEGEVVLGKRSERQGPQNVLDDDTGLRWSGRPRDDL